MQSLRSRIAGLFESWATIVAGHPVAVCAGCLLLMLGFLSQIPKLTVDTSIEGFLQKDSPAIVLYDDFRDQFGRDDRLVIGIETPEVMTRAFLERLRDFHVALERDVPFVEEVESLINLRAVYGTEDELLVEDLLEDWPEDAAALARVRDYAEANPLYRSTWLPPAGDFTMVTVTFQRYGGDLSDDMVLDEFNFEGDTGTGPVTTAPYLEEDKIDEGVVRVLQLLDQYSAPEFRLHVAGMPILTYRLRDSMLTDMQFFVAIGFVTIGFVLFLLFRSLGATISPLVVVICSLVSTVSCMAMAGEPIQLPTQVLPSFLLAIGVADSVHVITIFHQQLRAGEAKADALRIAMGHAGLPILFTSLTTAGGMASFLTSGLAPVATIGTYAPIGVFFAFFYSLVLLPALLILFPAKPHRDPDRRTRSGRLLVAAGAMAIAHPYKVVGMTAAITVVAAVAASQLRFSHNPMNWFPDDAPIKVATQTIDCATSGTVSMEIVVDKGEHYAFHSPANLAKLQAIAASAEAFANSPVETRETLSLVDILKEIHQALNENRASHYVLAESGPLISQELLLFENSGADDLEKLVDTVYSKARLTLMVNWADALEFAPYAQRVEQLVLEHFEADEVTITGILPILSTTFSMLIKSVASSFVTALIVIVPLMMLMVGSVKTGSLSMAPNVLPILFCLGFMSLTDIPIDGFTLLIGGVAIGLVVDDTIHFLHHYKRYFDETGSVDLAIASTLETTGRAMLFTTMVLVCGFMTFTLSSMVNLIYFGLLTSMTVTLALLADIVLLPALATIFFKRDERPR